NTNDKIMNNTVDGFFLGISLKNANHSAVSGNRVTHCDSAGIFIFSSTANTVSMNSVAQCFEGIDVQADGNTVFKNTVTGISNVGINVTASQNTISGNSVSHNEGNGIVVRGFVPPLMQNKISGNTVNFNFGGIAVENANGCTISGNVVNNNQNNGIDL